jgi:hypothetical protein
MDAKTLTALQGSIMKWEKIVAGTGVDRGTENCPLCEMFFNEDYFNEEPCNGCPVAKKTGKLYCYGTPYGAYANLCDWGGKAGEPATMQEQKAAAQAELDFLRSLLP